LSTIDLATFRELQANAGPEFVVELAQAFREEAPKMIEDMRSALTAKDAERFRRAAHSMKSNGKTFGATKLADLAKDLELGGLDTALAAANPLAALEHEYARVAAELAELAHA
jgi:HPt (histidine-containing phosphotransfer) domain-containing protein